MGRKKLPYIGKNVIIERTLHRGVKRIIHPPRKWRVEERTKRHIIYVGESKMLIRYRGGEIREPALNTVYVIKVEKDDDFWRVATGTRRQLWDTGLKFKRKCDALNFAKTVMKKMSRGEWWIR